MDFKTKLYPGGATLPVCDPCPFCGSVDGPTPGGDNVMCDNCGASTDGQYIGWGPSEPDDNTMMRAVRRWNTRRSKPVRDPENFVAPKPAPYETVESYMWRIKEAYELWAIEG